jgi:hypothetical protein
VFFELNLSSILPVWYRQVNAVFLALASGGLWY